ncbi:MAG: LysM peptidoglycan-binding domain-containing protein [Victivallaceae bacterium]|nr:LysM peptidoglycan-binding domain-containing protein [Victivallaceae bacterium]
MNRKYLWLIGSVALAAVAAIGVIVLAVSTREETERPSYIRLQRALSDPDPMVGLAEAKHYLGRFPESAPAHRALANLYDERLNMPLEALGEYQRYLDCDPNADREEVGRWTAAARKRCFELWKPEFGGNGGSVKETSATSVELAELRAENAELRSRLEMLQKLLFAPEAPEIQPVVPPSVPAPETSAPPPAEQPPVNPPEDGFYTVIKGDTLGRIARKLYGEASRAGEIYEINRDKLSSPNKLREGMKLRLPSAVKPAAVPAAVPFSSLKPLSDEQKRLLEAASRGPAPKPGAETPANPAEQKPESKTEPASEPVSGAQVTPYLY